MSASLDVDVHVLRGAFSLQAALGVPAGEVVAVLGPNGAGKSTLLAAISGVLRPDTGYVRVGDRTLTSAPIRGNSGERKRKANVAPEFRRVGLLRQDPLLFPHLSAVANVAFGMRAQGTDRHRALREAAEWLDAVGLPNVAERKPSALSGGQQQRVAIARALAAHPDVLLLDEPLAALDVETAVQIRRMLADRLRESGTTTLVVTHDVVDALVLAPRCAILHDGRIVDDGPIGGVLGRPKTPFIAALAGVNLLSGRIGSDGSVVVNDGLVLRGTMEGGCPAPGSAVTAVFGFAAVHLSAESSLHTADNSWVATIETFEPATSGLRIRTRENGGIVVDVAPAAVAGLDARPGARVRLSLAAADLIIRAID